MTGRRSACIGLVRWRFRILQAKRMREALKLEDSPATWTETKL
jgi:hypothetical protein